MSVYPGMMEFVIPVLEKLKQEGCCEFEASQGYIVRPCLRKLSSVHTHPKKGKEKQWFPILELQGVEIVLWVPVSQNRYSTPYRGSSLWPHADAAHSKNQCCLSYPILHNSESRLARLGDTCLKAEAGKLLSVVLSYIVHSGSLK